MTKGRLFFTIAPARAGKTTFANNWVKQIDVERPRVIVSQDDIHLALGHRFNSNVHQLVTTIADTMTKAHLLRGCDVLLDETHTTWNNVSRVLRIDPDAQPIWIEFNLPELHRRADATNQSDLHSVIERHVMQYRNLMSEWNEYINIKRNHSRLYFSKKGIV